MRTLITMSGSRYEETTGTIVGDAPRFGADRVLVYDDAWVREHDFYRVNRWLWEHPGDRNGPRGFGWYAWKPLVILDALDRSAPGDVVLYQDADTIPIADLTPVFQIAERDGGWFVKAQTHSNHRWNKRDCLIAMGQDDDRTRYADAGCARFLAVKKGPWVVTQLLWEWLTYAINPIATTFDPSRYGGEHPEFEEHRTEQAILTNLCHKHGFKLWREADQSGEESPDDRDVYGRLFTQIQQGSCQNGPGSRFRNV